MRNSILRTSIGVLRRSSDSSVALENKRVARDDAFGYVLAGGRSQRMGQDKALLRVRGEMLVERALGTIRKVVSEVAIVGDRPDIARFAEIVPDAAVGVGPVAGLVAGTRHCTREWALFMPVDVPEMSAETLTQM